MKNIGEPVMQSFSCVLFLATLTSAAVSASLGGIGVVRPNNPYIYIGSNLTLTCNLTKFDTEYNSRYLKFTRKNDEVIPAQYINLATTRSIILNYPITSPDDEGRYMCLLQRSGRPEIVGSQHVLVEYEPQKVEDIKCLVYNWENMTCEWDLQHVFVHPELLSIILVWVIENASDGQQFECPHQTNTSCSWLELDTLGDQFVSDARYLMAVSIHNEKTNKMYTSKTLKVDTTQVVQPAPVIELVANASSTCITTRWRHSKARRELIYKVEFKEEKQMTWNVKHVDTMESFTQCDLKPHTVYLFSVSCRPGRHGRPHGYWSDNVTITVETKEDVPTNAPRLHSGSYTEQLCPQNNCKKLMLYWKPLDPKYANGEIVQYWMTYENMEQNQKEVMEVPYNNYEVTVMLNAGDNYMIHLQAATKVGLSKTASKIHVPPKDEKPEIPDLVVEAHNMSDQTLINLQWDSPRVWTSANWRNLTSFTVYWCKGYKISQSCYDSIQWRELPISQTKLSMPVNLYDDSFENYLFGVGVNAVTESGENISSGLKWNSCTYVLNWKPDRAPLNIRLSTFQPNKGLSVEWDKLGCSDTPAYIQDYLVNICPSDYGQNCTGGVTSYTVGNKKTSFTVTNLKHDVRYRVWLRAVSKGGMSPNSEPVYETVVDKSLNPGEISGIVIGGLFVLIIFLFGIILCTRRVVRTVQKKFEPVPIDLPPTLPPLPPIPMPPQKWSRSTSPGSSDGIYERIDGPPSPTSSVDSSAGAEAPLIHNKMKLNTMKEQIHNKKKDQRDSYDSGKGSISHSADTLLMRLHPSHLRKARDKKNKYRGNQSDSGIALDSRSQPSCMYSNGGPSSDVSPYSTSPVSKCTVNVSSGEANPYSCVNIVDKINAKSEKLKRKLSSGNTSSDGGERSSSTDKSYNTGSTISLPPPSVILQTFQSGPLNYRTKSADNELDFTERKLSCMKEALEIDSSDVYSEDGTLDDTDPREQYSGSSAESREPKHINSYVRCGDGYVQDMNVAMAKPQQHFKCDCEVKTNLPTVTADGYVKQEVFANGHAIGHVCGCEKQKLTDLLAPNGSLEAIKAGLRPVSQVMNLPPHYFGSLSTVLIDPSTTTEL